MARFSSSTDNGRRWIAGPAELFLLLGCLGILAVAGVLPLTAAQQWVFGGCLIALALWADVASRSYVTTLMMMLLSSFATFRYAVWRYGTLIEFFRYPSAERKPLDIFFMSILALAELYTMLILYLGYFQMAYPLKRKPVAMPDELELWPDVDVLIPTYNEPLELVRYTVLAAMNMDWPPEKLHIFLLDDGQRQEFRDFAERAGVAYVTRSDNQGAKAGNINHALAGTHSPYVAIFDCDHVPVRSFLQFTMGWFFRDKKMALVQTPHHFYSPDPFQRNLKQYSEMPNEGQLFHGIVQVCNDFWNASFFCGSCAVIRREALDEAGGIATETVTEDAHTSMRMQMAGWNTAYLNTPQAAGLATERLSGHVKQRIRWARGMIQILRRDNPLFAPRLSWAQRLCYFNAMIHFLYALPRLIFLTAPLVYLLFGCEVLPGSWVLILAFATPHLLLAQITNSRIQGEHRHSFWNEVYEAVLAPYILLPTLLALISPKSGRFDVTNKGGIKGGIVEESYLDLHIARPFFILLFFNLLGLAMVPVRILYLDRMHPGTVLINALWDLLSIVIVGVVIGVAHESQQRRSSTRIAMRTLAWIVLPDGSAYEGSTVDLSAGGSAIHLDDYLPPSGGVEVQVVLPRPSGTNVSLPARIVGGGGRVVRVQFQELSIAQERKLVGVLFSRANAWLNWADNTTHDSLWRSFGLIVKLSGTGIGQAAHSLFTLRPLRPARRRKSAVTAPASTLLLLLVLGGLAIASPDGNAQQSSTAIASAQAIANKTASRIAIANNLNLLPLPFFDPDSSVTPNIAMVFPAPPSPLELQAASVVASWIGMMADYRRARFSVSVGTIPAGNAIVFGTASAPSNVSEFSLSQLGLAAIPGPTLAMRTNPGDAYGKLLIVAGKNDAQLLEAAQALAIHSDVLAGDTARVSAHLPALREADDAPRWLGGRESVTLEEMQSRTLDSDGSAPIEADLHTAPDLYYGLRRNLRLYLYARYNPVSLAPHAHMNVSINQAYVGAIPLPAGPQAFSERRELLAIPTEDMAPSANTLRVDFFLPMKAATRANGSLPPSGTILPNSYLDLKGIPHWAAMPDLRLFANAGFPFTRFADLAQTTVILPQRPSPAEMELLLTLVAQMSAETGVPALRLTVASPGELGKIPDRDVLVLGSAKDQPAFARLARSLPVLPRATGLNIRQGEGKFAPIENFWGRIQGLPVEEDGRVQISGASPDALIEGIESPYRAGRSVVLVMVRGDSNVAPFLTAFGAAVNSSEIAQSVSILRGNSFTSYRPGNSFYHVGKLPLWDLLSIEQAAFPWLGALGLLFVCFLLALLAQSSLRRRASGRLLDRTDRGKAGEDDRREWVW